MEGMVRESRSRMQRGEIRGWQIKEGKRVTRAGDWVIGLGTRNVFERSLDGFMENKMEAWE